MVRPRLRAPAEPKDGRRRIRPVRRPARSRGAAGCPGLLRRQGTADQRCPGPREQVHHPAHAAVPVDRHGARDELVHGDRPATPYSEQDANSVVGAGPYYIASREAGRTLVLDRNRNYRGNRPANPDRIVVTVAGEPNQSVLQIKAGQADYDPLIPSAAAGALGDEFGVNKGRFFVKPTSATSYWALNSLPGQPLNNVKLRQAINWAIDRPARSGSPASSADAVRRRSSRPRCRVPPEQQHLRVQRRECRKGQAGRGRHQQRARAPRRTLEHGREHQPRPGHAVQPRGDGSQGADGADPERAALLARWGQEGQLRRPGDRLAGRLPGPVELHQHPPRRA